MASRNKSRCRRPQPRARLERQGDTDDHVSPGRATAAVRRSVTRNSCPVGAEPQNKSEDQNLATIKSAFDAWRAGTRSPFDKLTPDTTWTIVGNSVVAGTYHGKADVQDNVLTPFNARLSHGLVPTVNNIYSDGDTVIALFDAGSTTARDGLPYHNSYACSCVYARVKSSTSQHSSTASPSTTCGNESPRPHNRERVPEPTMSQF